MKVNVNLRGEKEFRRILNRYERGTENDISRELTRSAYNIQSSAKRKAPVDTGFLRSNIVVNIARKLTKTVRSMAEYSSYLEFGTSKMAARPYMRPAWEEERPKLLSRLKKILNARRK